MFARLVTVDLKPGMAAEFRKTVETAILPVLKRQPGFQEELALVSPDGTQAVGISMWDNRQHAETYAQTSYPELEELLLKLTDNPIHVQTYDVARATFTDLAAKRGGAAA